ncbi:MAG TPA: hypothetical protein VI793_10780, partial [Anaerolineales bacterium]|nr:hypothetical protein [Anaerolineales bacterium]
RLIGITDTSMLRPQVFALQQGGPGEPSIGLAASEKQAIDAALASLAQEDVRFWARPDRVWNARGAATRTAARSSSTCGAIKTGRRN